MAVPVGVVLPGLGVGQRGLAFPAVRQHPVVLVEQPLLPELLDRPHDALHVGKVHGLVVVVEVDPASLARHVALPLLGVTEHRGLAVAVELGDAELSDRAPARDSELPFGLHFRRQPVAVPAEAPLDPLAPHGAVSGHRVLDVSGQKVPVVGKAVRERRPVVEHELLRGRPVGDRAPEGVSVPPGREDLRFDLREARGSRDVRVSGIGAGGHPNTIWRNICLAAGVYPPPVTVGARGRVRGPLGRAGCRDPQSDKQDETEVLRKLRKATSSSSSTTTAKPAPRAPDKAAAKAVPAAAQPKTAAPKAAAKPAKPAKQPAKAAAKEAPPTTGKTGQAAGGHQVDQGDGQAGGQGRGGQDGRQDQP